MGHGMTAILSKYEGFVENTNLNEEQQVLKDEHKIVFGCSGDGECWYKIRKSLQDDTVKVVYENDGSIRHIDFGPGDSVATPMGGNLVELESIPDAVKNEMHFWKFDGEKFVEHEENRVKYNTYMRKKKLTSVSEEISILSDMVELKMTRSADTNALTELKKKRIQLAQMNLTEVIDWNEF